MSMDDEEPPGKRTFLHSDHSGKVFLSPQILPEQMHTDQVTPNMSCA